MKKITCIQNYVIDKLIEDEKLSTNSLLDAVSKVCSEEQFNNILSILIETPIPCTNIPELERSITNDEEYKFTLRNPITNQNSTVYVKYYLYHHVYFVGDTIK